MPKKKGDKEKKKKKSGKSKKPKDPEMTTEEAILAYKVSILEKQLEEQRYYLHVATEENLHNKERNNALAEEQEKVLKVMHQEASKFAAKSRDATITEKEAVIEAMKQKWAVEKDEIADVNSIREEIKQTAKKVKDARNEIKLWKTYRDEILPKQKTEAKLYEQELLDLEVTFEDIQHHLQLNLQINKKKIDESRQRLVVKEKESAASKASVIIDRDTKREVADNMWLKEEVERHTNLVVQLRRDVQDLENGNLNILSNLFDCKKEDLQFSPRFFMTQFEDHENLEISTRLQYDLEGMRKPRSGEHLQPGEKKRPKSGVLKAVEKKLEQLNVRVEGQQASDESEAEQDVLVAMPFRTRYMSSSGASSSRSFSSSIFDEKRVLAVLRSSSGMDNTFDFFTGEPVSEPEDDSLVERVVAQSKGGPLEFKLLNIVGKRIDLADPDTEAAEMLEEEKLMTGARKTEWKIPL